jgi:FtsH-binding integral membrane protein
VVAIVNALFRICLTCRLYVAVTKKEYKVIWAFLIVLVVLFFLDAIIQIWRNYKTNLRNTLVSAAIGGVITLLFAGLLY